MRKIALALSLSLLSLSAAAQEKKDYVVQWSKLDGMYMVDAISQGYSLVSVQEYVQMYDGCPQFDRTFYLQKPGSLLKCSERYACSGKPEAVVRECSQVVKPKKLN